MSVRLQPITPRDLTPPERDSILSHAIDLHLVGSNDADSIGFDIVEKKSTNVLFLLRALDGNAPVGIAYLLPVAGETQMAEMTVLIFPEFRGKHYTEPLVKSIEDFFQKNLPARPLLCATIHDHNPMRKELADFLLRHGYRYSANHGMFVKRLG